MIVINKRKIVDVGSDMELYAVALKIATALDLDPKPTTAPKELREYVNGLQDVLTLGDAPAMKLRDHEVVTLTKAGFKNAEAFLKWEEPKAELVKAEKKATRLDIFHALVTEYEPATQANLVSGMMELHADTEESRKIAENRVCVYAGVLVKFGVAHWDEEKKLILDIEEG